MYCNQCSTAGAGYHKNSNEFVLIVVLFILLVIVGAYYFSQGC